MDWPARTFTTMRAARNIFRAYYGYRQAPDKVAWCNTNPESWELVSMTLALKEGLYE